MIGREPINWYATLIRHPKLFESWRPLFKAVVNGLLDVRDREILILRVGWRCRSAYVWGTHVDKGLAAGLTKREIEKLRQDGSHWDSSDEALIAAVDQLHDSGTVDDATWRELAKFLDERQLIEVPMVIGHHHMISFAINFLGVENDLEIPGLTDLIADC